jgi:hypothetical protein
MRETEWNTVCQFCGAEHEVAACFGAGNTPNDGDLSLCMICGEWNMFCMDAPGRMRKPTDAEYDAIAGSQRASAARQVWIDIQAERKNRSKG